jgi:hypothetical protein
MADGGRDIARPHAVSEYQAAARSGGEGHDAQLVGCDDDGQRRTDAWPDPDKGQKAANCLQLNPPIGASRSSGGANDLGEATVDQAASQRR